METPTLKILYGPPGTGKTWQACRDAVRLIDPAATDTEIESKHKSFVEAGRIIWVTFHPSYSYEDFVEGFRPESSGNGIVYTAKPGPFKMACDLATKKTHPGVYFWQGKEIRSSSGKQYEIVECNNGGVVVRNNKPGDRGEGKHTPVSFWIISRLQSVGYESTSLGIPGSQPAKQLDVVDNSEIDKQSLFGMTGPLRAVWEEIERQERAQARDGIPVVLVIDEINRADLSRVFGELITILEPNKRLAAPEEKRVILPYSQELFGIPSTLHIIGTMNTTDRSIAILDHALRRRFDFEEVPSIPDLCESPYGPVDIKDLLMKWNKRIIALLSRDHCIGHAYFMKSRLEFHREQNNYQDNDDGKLKTLASIIRKNILPMLLEYFFDDWRKVDIIFGRDFSNNTGGLLEPLDFSEIESAAEDVIDLSEATDFLIPDFWDPENTAWDHDRFKNSLV